MNPIIVCHGTLVDLPLCDVERDLELALRWVNSPISYQFLNRDRPITRDEEQHALERLSKSDDKLFLVIVDKTTDESIGTCGLHGIHPTHRFATYGIMIGEERFHNGGRGTEACKLICAFGLDVLNLHKICASVYANNPRSERHMKKLGFVEEGRRIAQMWRLGEWVDEVLLGLFSENFRR